MVLQELSTRVSPGLSSIGAILAPVVVVQMLASIVSLGILEQREVGPTDATLESSHLDCSFRRWHHLS